MTTTAPNHAASPNASAILPPPSLHHSIQGSHFVPLFAFSTSNSGLNPLRSSNLQHADPKKTKSRFWSTEVHGSPPKSTGPLPGKPPDAPSSPIGYSADPPALRTPHSNIGYWLSAIHPPSSILSHPSSPPPAPAFFDLQARPI